MRKVVSFLLLSLYLLPATGAGLNLHFCGEVMQQQTLTHFSPTTCCEQTQAPMDCCHDEVQASTDESTQAASFQAPLAFGWVLLFVIPSFYEFFARTKTGFSPAFGADDAPPLSALCPLYLWVASFRL